MDKQTVAVNQDKVNKFIQDIKDIKGDVVSVTITGENKKLLTQSKSLEELTVSRKFQVKRVLCENESTYLRIEEGILSYNVEAGYSTKITLDVITSDTESNPVRTLTFHGYSAVRAGDFIKALMPTYTERILRYETREEFVENLRYPPTRHNETVFIERPLHKKESAIELCILDDKTNIVRCDRAVDYYKYKKK